MKTSTVIFLIVMMVMMNTPFATAQKLQEKDVPTNVKAAFQKMYTKATKTKWSRESDKYEAEFEINKEETSVVIDASGNITETEVEIAINQFPKEVTEYVKSTYKGQSVKEAAKITDEKGVITYEAEIKGKDLIFDKDGKFLRELKK